MSTINGVPARQSGGETEALFDRRRPGRVATDNPHLIQLLRGDGAVSSSTAECGPPHDDDVPRYQPGALRLIILLCIALWAGAVLLVLR
jgi:hypothetical protein